MTNQKRTIMGALDYSIIALQNIKKDLCIADNPHAEINWAVGGVVTMMVAHLIRACGDVMYNAIKNSDSHEGGIKEDIAEIQRRFNEFCAEGLNRE